MELLGLQDLLVLQDFQAHLEALDPQEVKALQGQQDLLVIKELQELKEIQVTKVNKALLDHPDFQAKLDSLVHLEQLVTLVTRAVQASLDF